MPMMPRRGFLQLVAMGAAGGALGCDVREYARRHGAKLRLSIATGQAGAVYYVYGGGIARVISANLPNVEATAEITGATIDNLKLLRAAQADLAFGLGSTIADAYAGTGAFRRFGRVPVRTLAVLYLQPMHLVTRASLGIGSVAQLRGRVVCTGAPGSGTEDVALRMLDVAGLDPLRDVRRERLGPAQSADALKDGKLDAFFMSAGAPVGALLDLAVSLGPEMVLLPNDDVLPALQRRWGATQFLRVVIPARTYPGQTRDVGTIGSASLLIVDASMDDDLVYEITRTIFEHRAELAVIHPAARALAPERAVVGAPVPFHPGAIRFYRERGVWPS